jgi:hypothetical protein
MPSIQDLIRDRTKRLNAAPDRLLSSVARIQRGILGPILDQLDTLERDASGAIIRSAANLTRAAEITQSLKAVLTGKEYLQALAAFAGEFDASKRTNDAIFRKAFPEFQVSEMADLTLTTSKAAAVDLLAGATATTNFLLPLRGAIEQAVTSGADWRTTLREMTKLINGDADIHGKLEQHVKQVAWDALAVADRSYSAAVSDDLGVEWFLYAGTEIATTRPFCQERVGKYYTRAMVESWADLEWAGKMNENTNSATIFQNLGGWNCRHVLVPVSAASVPEWLRAKVEGRTTGQSSVALNGG